MFDFCQHCGRTLGQEEIEGRVLVCQSCGKSIGKVAPPAKKMIDTSEALIQGGTVARCPLCQQIVEIRSKGPVKSYVPHLGKSEARKMCPNSGKPVVAQPAPEAAAPMARPATSKDLSKYITHESSKVIACRKNAAPTIEVLTLEYLDKSERVRVQIEALREILGGPFKMTDYPSALSQPDLAQWSNAAACVVARRHLQGGYRTLAEAELARVVQDFKNSHRLFFQ